MNGRGEKREYSSGRREQRQSERAMDRSGGTAAQARPDYLLVLCLILLYLELSWLILMLLRTYSRH